MLFWVVDNNYLMVALLLIVAVGFAAVWWNTRQTTYLAGVAVPAVLMVVVVVLSFVVVTDARQLERNVDELRDLINAGKYDEVLKMCDDEVEVESKQGKSVIKKSQVAPLAKQNKEAYHVKKIFTSGFQVDEVSRPKAKVHFTIITDEEYRALCRMDFVLAADGKWRVKGVSVEYVLGGQKAPALLPPPFGGGL